MEYINDKTAEKLGLKWIMEKLQPLSPLGRAAKAQMKPYGKDQAADLDKELNRVFYMCDKFKKDPGLWDDLVTILSRVKDITGSIKRTRKGGVLDEVEFFELKVFLMQCTKLSKLASKIETDIKIKVFKGLLKVLDPQETGRRSFYIEDDFSTRLKWIRKRIRQVKKEIKHEEELLHIKITQILGIKPNPKGEININKGDSLIEKLSSSPLVRYVRENFASVVYAPKPTEKQIELKARLGKLQQMESDEEFQIRKSFSNEVKKYSGELLETAQNIGKLDLLCAKTRLALELKSTKPEIVKENIVDIEKGRHPVVEAALRKKGLEFQPINIRLSQTATVITGANMGGKTVTLKMTGLLVTMAQMGLLVPAQKMRFSPRNFVFFSGSYGESMEDGLSAFGAEIKALIQILPYVNKSGLILLDELARGTNPLEGMAIAKAIVKKLKSSSCLSIITTHFYKVATIEGVVHLQVRGLRDIKTDWIKQELKRGRALGPELLNKIMDYSLVKVSPKASPPHDAIKVARMMGFDEEVLKDAEFYINNEREE